ncbi:2-amino-4-hydroxy-6-hydroxymethyldihydropteridine diphosphokinase [Parafilimonas sp.]|uniref:2-amino-4-hydroxy-6- hydroxymethyldihydropteridine diphosphokinase n=1 Tax=Parafilimonas sp. TaxID=1969739 RepID=UPI0039E660BC
MAFLLTGSNLGNRLQNLRTAAALVEKHCGSIGSTSSIYQTAAWGFAEQPDFYNQALSVSTLLEPDALMQQLLAIESSMGRQRSFKMAPRIIDIDILLMNETEHDNFSHTGECTWRGSMRQLKKQICTNEIIYESAVVTIPHPRLAERRFVLTPLAEIAGNIIHPEYKKTMNELLAECKDKLAVHKISAKK